MSSGSCFGGLNLSNNFNCYRSVGCRCLPNCIATVPRALITSKYLRRNLNLRLC